MKKILDKIRKNKFWSGLAIGLVLFSAVAATYTYVVGPSGVTDETIVRFDGTSGGILQGSTITITDAGDLDLNTGDITDVGTLTTTAADVENAYLTNVFRVNDELSATSQATNYTITPVPSVRNINLANTNVYAQITTFSEGHFWRVYFDALTNTVDSTITFSNTLYYDTNQSLTVTKGTALPIEFYAINGTTVYLDILDPIVSVAGTVPTPDPDYHFDFENTGAGPDNNGTATDWTAAGTGTIDPDATTWAGLTGTYHADADAGEAGWNDTSLAEMTHVWCYAEFELNGTAASSATFLAWGQGAPDYGQWYVAFLNGNAVRISGGGVNSDTTDTLTTGTKYYMLIHYEDNGSGGVDTFSVEVNSSGTFNGSGTDFAQHTTGDYNTGATRFYLHNTTLPTGWAWDSDEIKMWVNSNADNYQPY